MELRYLSVKVLKHARMPKLLHRMICFDNNNSQGCNRQQHCFVLAELLGKDGHKNRRSVTLIDSFAKTLNELKL